ncbi:RNA-binding S4 domain-containing protein [Thiobacillus sp.]|uniref:RNA-binding S4 domain-containing protein n=1 Tax=Thiobacillus sp. TaxID=924 RepID=UPI0025F0BBA5|nr:RNA-binding S4 domain-containing protein [Thiobacillus sp.]
MNGERVKPARDVKPGDRLDLHLGEIDWTLTVRALAMQRGPAPVAQALYQEDPASQVRRQRQADDRKLATNPAATIKGRPTKRDRRQIHRFTDE